MTRERQRHIFGHNSTVRVYLRKCKRDKQIVWLVAIPNLPDGEAVIRITGEGSLRHSEIAEISERPVLQAGNITQYLKAFQLRRD